MSATVSNAPAAGAVIRPEVLWPGRPDLHAAVPWRPAPPGYAGTPLTSTVCRFDQLDSPRFRGWATRLGEPWNPHRKLWEYCFICSALEERGMLAPGRRGLGFAVGTEPLPAVFAALGCTIVASDLPGDDSRVALWSPSAQWAEGLTALNARGHCEEQLFRERVSFRPVDMNAIPADLVGFDFTWSSCSFEHCGSIEQGLRFVREQMKCLVPGGVAVHTTELNLSSDTSTLEAGPTVIFRRSDIERLVGELRDAGHEVAPLDLWVGDHRIDAHVDRYPYEQKEHLRLELGGFVTTSVALIVRRGA